LSVADLHKAEVDRGERFAFGENWSRFLKNLTVARILLAEESLKSSLQLDRLDGLTFLDVGSGSGLFSLCARRLGAKVHSFDFDTHSVACTRELRKRYFPDDANWIVEQGSVLDRDYLSTLGTFDIVYSWGVLHHTGAMYEALENVKPLVPVGGRLFIAIYNDQGEPTDDWERIKRLYNRLPKPLAFAFALKIIARDELRSWEHHKHNEGLKSYLATWTDYDKSSTRGMSKWHDWIDWIGGYPYERATVEQIVDFYAPDGFELQLLIDRSSGYGCNEFVFRRVAGQGTYVDSRLEGGNSMARRLGYRVVQPLSEKPDGIYGKVNLPPGMDPTALIVIHNNKIIGQAELSEDGRVRLPPIKGGLDTVMNAGVYVVPAQSRILTPPFTCTRGKMWQADLPDLLHIADDESDPRRSSAFLFEDDVQLPFPHATHDEIDRYGSGRFSHWGTGIYFSTLDGDDPNTNGKTYRLLTIPQPISGDRSFAHRFGIRADGPPVLEDNRWTVAVPGYLVGQPLLVLRNDRLISVHDEAPERVVIAAAAESSGTSENENVFLVPGRVVDLSGCSFKHQRELLWSLACEEVEGLGDDATDGRSPIFLFEDGRQLPYPHRSHDSIAANGAGAFSVWDGAVWFSTSDGSDPNDNHRTYTLAIPSDLLDG